MMAQLKLRCYDCRAIFIWRTANLEYSEAPIACPGCLQVVKPYVVIDIMEIGAVT